MINRSSLDYLNKLYVFPNKISKMTYKHWHFLNHKFVIVLVDPPSLALNDNNFLSYVLHQLFYICCVYGNLGLSLNYE